jgi:pimeloyl-ACP methyl ester carboxylesterase
MHAARSERVEALVLVDSGHLDYAEVLGEDVARPIEDWVEEARDRRLRVADEATLAKELELDADDPIMDLLLVAMEYDESGSGEMVSRVRPEAQGRARYHLAHARQSETWDTIAAAGTPTLLLLATEPEQARTQNEAAAGRFRAAVPHADVRLVPGATHSLITDLRDEFGRTVAGWLDPIAR